MAGNLEITGDFEAKDCTAPHYSPSSQCSSWRKRKHTPAQHKNKKAQWQKENFKVQELISVRVMGARHENLKVRVSYDQELGRGVVAYFV